MTHIESITRIVKDIAEFEAKQDYRLASAYKVLAEEAKQAAKEARQAARKAKAKK